MKAIKAGIAYFGLAFAAGFAMGTVRVLFLVPRLGERLAELLEMPFMLVAIWWAARFVARRFALARVVSVRLTTGLVALILLLGAEILLAAMLQDRSLGDYLASRDPVSGGVYLLMLGLFAAMPLILARCTSKA
ncbi:hypothetical protein [Dechloromonas sp. A34]|uniref:hypothetical protein n=1 Tax=Dechloromonas sp. A34 TaxID=447588 RepID=UPI0022494335|nr:hypothetical protein [Dechloromonas sp. A34]